MAESIVFLLTISLLICCSYADDLLSHVREGDRKLSGVNVVNKLFSSEGGLTAGGAISKGKDDLTKEGVKQLPGQITQPQTQPQPQPDPQPQTQTQPQPQTQTQPQPQTSSTPPPPLLPLPPQPSLLSPSPSPSLPLPLEGDVEHIPDDQTEPSTATKLFGKAGFILLYAIVCVIGIIV